MALFTKDAHGSDVPCTTMVMKQDTEFLALALLLLTGAGANAQDVTIGIDEEDRAQEIAVDSVAEEQMIPVAEEGIDDVEDYSVPEPNDADMLANEFALFKQLMQDGVLDEADTVAKRIVELAIKLKGPQSNEFAKALTNLAIVQHQTEQYDAAQQNFEAAIEIIEDNEDRLNSQLINPLTGLGASQLESGRPDLALTTYGRAVHLTHVNEGPHNLEQVDLLESLAETYVRMGDFDSAKEIQDTIYALNIRQHSLDTLELIPALLRRAAWQHRAGFVYDERTTYRRIIRIVEEKSGKDDLALIEPLILLGKSFFYPDLSGAQTFQDARLTSGEIYFRRAAKIAAENPNSDWQVVAQTTLSLGDYYMFNHNPQRGTQVYREAWELLSADEERLAVRREQLETVVPLWQQKLPEFIAAGDSEAGPQSDDVLLQGTIKMSYDISSRGRAVNLKLVEANPPEFTEMQRTVQREIRRRVYRPRFEDGGPVAVTGLLLVHKFNYRQSDLDALRAAAAESAESDSDSED